MKNEFSIPSLKLRLRQHPKGHFKDVSDEHIEYLLRFALEFTRRKLKNPVAPIMNFRFGTVVLRYKKCEKILAKQINALWLLKDDPEYEMLHGIFYHREFPEDHPYHIYSPSQIHRLMDLEMSSFTDPNLKKLWRTVKLQYLLELYGEHWAYSKLAQGFMAVNRDRDLWEIPCYLNSFTDRMKKYKIWDVSLSETYMHMLKEQGEICLEESYRMPCQHTLKNNLHFGALKQKNV